VESSSLAFNKLELKKSGYAVYGADSIVGYIDTYQHSERYISIVKDGSGVGRLNLCKPETSILGTLSALKSKNENKYLIVWAYYLLNTIDFSSYVKGAGIPHIYYSDYKHHTIGVAKPAEQQKIASCLSSLDELITAESQKLELLKQHKKGLLQNLFPQEGETLPKLRFKEFENSGEWVVKKLGEIAHFLKGKGISKADVDSKGKLPCIRYGELYTHYGEIIKEIKSFTNLREDDLMLSEPNDVIIPSSGETKEDIATASCVKLGGVALGGDLNILRTSLNGDFLAYYLSNGLKKVISKIAQGDAVVHLYATQLKKLTIGVPSMKEEQEKIASCLSSLDEVITAQTQKIEQLQRHKKGLLQGLFPNINNE